MKTVILSPSYRQSIIFLESLHKEFISETLLFKSVDKIELKIGKSTMIAFPIGNSLTALNKIRGYRFNRIILNEFKFMSKEFIDEVKKLAQANNCIIYYTNESDREITQNILQEIKKERQKQVEKWGVQNHLNEHWLCILAEEFGEAAQLVTKGEVPPKEMDNKIYLKNLREELIQTAAVCVAWLENLEEKDLFLKGVIK